MDAYNKKTIIKTELAAVRLKVCGMKQAKNMLELSVIRPDYMGLIFYNKSSRFFEGNLPELSEEIKKVGVFVNPELSEVLSKVNQHQLSAIQLHGQESPGFCSDLKAALKNGIDIIKVFSIKDSFDFSVLSAYEDVCDYFLFDTKGQLPGGNGETFDWNLLENYPSQKPYFLSGGIGLETTKELKSFLNSPVSTYCHAIDVNSKFEEKPGLKNINELKKFKEIIHNEN